MAGTPPGPVDTGGGLPDISPGRPLDPAERCEMCGVAITERHSHVVALQRRALMCACRPCALLFTERGAGGGRYRTVPERYLRDPSLTVTEAHWDELRIPVRMAFFFHNSDLGRVLAFYPSPAGATESLLPLASWRDGLGRSRLAAELELDVEALLVGQGRDGQNCCLLVPIDACYTLVGLVRLYWKGFDGGTELWERIDAFFADLSELARDLEDG